MKTLVLLCLTMACCQALALPQQRFVSSVQEVVDPALKRQIFEEIQSGSRSILYKSLFPELNEGDVVGEIVVEVESPVLSLSKPKDPEQKLREKGIPRV